MRKITLYLALVTMSVLLVAWTIIDIVYKGIRMMRYVAMKTIVSIINYMRPYERTVEVDKWENRFKEIYEKV